MGKKKGLILLIIGTVLVFLGLLLTVLEVMNNDKKEEEEKISELTTHYDKFMSYANKFNDVRKHYYDVVVNDLYNESVKDNYEIWIKELDDYKKLVDQIIEEATPLQTLCVGQVYNDKEINNNCEAYVINYETFMNYFMKDVEEFNKFITTYLAEYAPKDSKVELFQLDSNKYQYIDVNDDGKFIGKD